MRFILLASLLATAGCGGPATTKDPMENLPPYEPSLEAPKDVAAPPADAMKTESGLAYKFLVKGADGEKPTKDSRVEVHYTGWTTDGTKFDSSRERNQPAKFGLGQVIGGWTEGLQLMAPGDSVRFWIPEDLAYKGRPGKPAGMLVFDVELISFETPPPRPEPVPPPEAPADVAAPPADALTTASGLKYKVLEEGPGATKPSAKAMVVVHYAGWTTDGENFDYSRKRGGPAAFGVGGVIPGWTEGLQLMDQGDKYRLWIPEDLAYKGQQGRPAGMLVFDVELMEIHEPPDLSVPSDAKKTASGLQWKLLSDAKPDKKPSDNARVKANWIAWSSDLGGFDSNLGRPATDFTARMSRLEGLKEGLQLMNEGEKARFWLTDELAFQGRPGAPKPPIVYDVELVSFVEMPKRGDNTPIPVRGPATIVPKGAPAPAGTTPPAPAKGKGTTKAEPEAAPAPTKGKGTTKAEPAPAPAPVKGKGTTR